MFWFTELSATHLLAMIRKSKNPNFFFFKIAEQHSKQNLFKAPYEAKNPNDEMAGSLVQVFLFFRLRLHFGG